MPSFWALHAKHAYASIKGQKHAQDLPLLPLEITHVGCWAQAAHAADHTLDAGERGDPHALGAGECV